MTEKFLHGIKISGYRSFNKEVTFDNLDKINLIIGQNNSGKSNLLRFLTRHLGNLKGAGIAFNEINDNPKHNSTNLQVAFKVYKGSKALLEKAKDPYILDPLFGGQNHIWFYYTRNGNTLSHDQECQNKTFPHIEKISNQDLYNLFYRLTNSQGGNRQTWLERISAHINPRAQLDVRVDLIPAIRTIQQMPQNTSYSVQGNGYVTRDGIGDHSGLNLIEELFQLQNPREGEERQRDRFNQINAFMCEIIGNDTLKLEIPHTKDAVIVNMDQKRINIKELGSGIEEILIIAAKSTMFSKQIVCIEEPELHLHPSLQRKLIQYLYEKTDNQYFIATHSAHLLDAVKCSVYHIKLIDGYSQVVSVLNEKEKFNACNDLGYKASDLLQSNFIIWVEGPSDRIYLNHWIKSIDSTLIEGLHYSIMFYGGRLLSHLTAEDHTISEFIALQRLNQNMAIVIDSDRKQASEKINATKRRIRKEFEDKDYYVWITEGKEIENYIDPQIYLQSVKKIYGEDNTVYETPSQYADMTIFHKGSKRTEKNKAKIDKIRLAHEVASINSRLDVLNLQKAITKLVSEINKANLLNV